MSCTPIKFKGNIKMIVTVIYLSIALVSLAILIAYIICRRKRGRCFKFEIEPSTRGVSIVLDAGEDD